MKGVSSIVRFVLVFILVLTGSWQRAHGQQILPQVLTLNLKFPSPKSTSGTFLLNYSEPLRQLGPIRNTTPYPQPVVQESYLRDPNLTFVPWQFAERTLGLPGFTPMQRYASTTTWNYDSVFTPTRLATKVRRSRSAREQ